MYAIRSYYDALRRLALDPSEARPQILVIEDLHWIDETTEEFLRFIGDSLATRRVLTINRPDKLNALNAEARAALIERLDQARGDDGVRVVVITVITSYSIHYTKLYEPMIRTV